MVKPIKFQTENLKDHYRLLALIHSFAHHHPNTLREMSFKGCEERNLDVRKSCYFLHNPPTAILHLINNEKKQDNYLEIYGSNRGNIYWAVRKIEKIGHVKLNKLEESLKQ